MTDGARIPKHFGWTYPLAQFGAHLAFVPFFGLLFPRRIDAIAGEGAVTELSWALLTGAIVAGIAHIAAGHAGDLWLRRFGSRRGLIAAGWLMLVAAYAWLALAQSLSMMILAVIAFQIALNVLFAPLGALLTDYVPNQRKGTLAGWSNAALPVAGIGTAGLAYLFPADSPAAFMVTAAAISVCVLPLLLIWLPAETQVLAFERDDEVATNVTVQPAIRHDFAIAWIARLLVQLGGALVLGYLFSLLTFRSGNNGYPETASAALIILPFFAAAAGISGALVAGHTSDFLKRRLRPTSVAGIILTAALVLMSLETSWLVFLIAYSLFHIGLTAFITVDSALVAQLLAGNAQRGMWLGIMNLTNTLPGIFGPVLTLLAIGGLSGLSALQLVLTVSAIGAALASILITRIRSVR